MLRTKVSTADLPTTVVPETPVGTDVEKDIRDKVAAVLVRFPTKTIEAAADLTDEGVRLLKTGKRTLSTATLVKLARSKGELGPAVWAIFSELCGRPLSGAQWESPRLNSLFGALHQIAKSKGPEGAFAAAMIAAMNDEGEPPAERETAAIYDLFERKRG